MLRGLFGALSVTFRVAERELLPSGLKVTVSVQLAPAVSELPQALLLKSAAFVPLIAMLFSAQNPCGENHENDYGMAPSRSNSYRIAVVCYVMRGLTYRAVESFHP